MKYMINVCVGIIALLSIAAGAAKVMQSPQEMEFLQSAGMNMLMIMLFGLFQIIGGVLAVPQKARVYDAILAGLAFLLSMILILVSGNVMFGVLSGIPILMSVFVAYQSLKPTHSEP